MSFEEVITWIEKRIGHDLDLEEIDYLSIAFQAGRNLQIKRDTEIMAGRLKL